MTNFRTLQENYDYRREPDFDENNAQYRADNAREAAENHLYDAIRAGLDVPVDYETGTGGTTTYPLHSFVGEVNESAALILLAACSKACANVLPNTQTENDRAAAALLRKFVEHVCKHYADDNWSLHA